MVVGERYARRPRELAALRVALQVLLSEIDYGLTPLPAALERAARAAGGEVAAFLEDAARRLSARRDAGAQDALREALARADLALAAADRDVLLALGAALGTSGREDQVRHLMLALRRLELAEDEARREGERGQRLARWLGVLGSLALVLLLA